MSEGQRQGQKRKKSYYVQSYNKKGASRLHALEPGMRGFLITCNNREREAVREAYNLLNEYADQLYGQEHKPTGKDGEDATTSSEDDDVEAALRKEVSALKTGARWDERRFQVVRSGANNCVFIRTTVPRPDELVHSIMADVHQTQMTKSRFILRMQPVMASCKADEDKIEEMAEEVLPAFFGEELGGHTFSILFKVRNNNKVGRTVVLPLIGKVISEMCSANRVNLDAPELVVCVDVIRTVCCLSVLRDFALYRKYNIQEIVAGKDKSKDKNGSAESKEVTPAGLEGEDGGEGTVEVDGKEKGEAGPLEAVETLTCKEPSGEGECAGDVAEQTSGTETEEVVPPVCDTAAV